MVREVSRRGLVRYGAALGTAGVAGCWQVEDPRRTDGRPTTADERTRATDERRPTTDGGLAPASYVVDKHDGTVRSVDGRTGAVAFEGEAGADDADVIQSTFDALDDRAAETEPGDLGGRVFIRRNTYEIHGTGRSYGALKLSADASQVVSDFARLRFHPHEVYTEAGIREQVDFVVSGDDTLVRGLIVDGNKEERELPTRTFDVVGCERSWVDRCVVENGHSVDGNRGYGIAGPYDADHVTVSNCVIRNNDRHGAHPADDHGPMVDLTFQNCSFLDNENGISARSGASRMLIAGNYFAGNRRGVALTANDIPHETVLVTNNLFVDNDRGSKSAAGVEVAARFDVVRITDNVFRLPSAPGDADPDGDAMHVAAYARTGSGSLEVSGNHMTGGAGPGVFLSARGSQDTTAVERVLFEDNHVGDVHPRNWPVFVRGARRALVRNNYVHQPAGKAAPDIRFDPPLEHLAVTGNVLENVQLTVPDGIEDAHVSGTIEW